MQRYKVTTINDNDLLSCKYLLSFLNIFPS